MTYGGDGGRREQRAVENASGEIENAIDGAEQARMTRGAAQRERVFVMHLSTNDAAPPGATLCRHAPGRIGPECKSGRQFRVDQSLPGQALDSDAQQYEVDVRIDRQVLRCHRR